MNDEIATFTYSRSRKSSNRSISSLNQDVQAIACPKRTQGDGMENVAADRLLDIVEKPIKTRLGEALIYHPTNLKQNSTPPVTPTGQIVNLVPKTITQIKKEKHILHSLKTKEPKFIPYEPYKAAVNPIVPFEKKKRRSKNNLDINVMVSQLAHLKTEESIKDKQKEHTSIHVDSEVENLKKQYEAEIHKLKDENCQLENQLKFQAQVNGELKNLLVAAVGEDLETRVHLLTEDKLQLSQALLNSAKHLSTHQEQTEWLAGQCEVWRSKFLASSLMVEELAKWKAALCQRTTDLQESIKRLLEERSKVRDISMKTYRTLSIIRENFDPVGASRRHELPSTNILDLSEGSFQLAELLKINLLSGMDKVDLRREINVTGLEMKTTAEKNAEQLLMSPNIMMSQDAACSALVGAVRMFMPNSSASSNVGGIVNMACCAHCSGEVKQV
ncbi:golgin-45 [Phymastichus coffea]|uniref:golgin-45 n=1 Tax=Phymastichus coffea TaxID=108790 RepID=UPI00273AFD8A|nr:golgin-45 [Phymastichus coffea]